MHYDVELVNVSKRFAAVDVVDNVSLSIVSGECVGILGANGAGKTTLLSMISGVNRPTQGTVKLLGKDPRKRSSRVNLGVTPQGQGGDPHARVGEFLRFIASLYGTVRNVDSVIEEFHLSQLQSKRISDLSGGQARLVSIAASFVGNAQVILLDEPTTGLDINIRHTVWEALHMRHRKGHTILLTSHYLDEIQQLAERIIFMKSGSLVCDKPIKEFIGQIDTVLVRFYDPAILPRSVIQRCQQGEDGMVFFSSKDIKSDLAVLHDAGYPFSSIEIMRPSLENVYEILNSEK